MIASAQFTIISLCDVVTSDTPPENPYEGQLWVDTSVTPPETKIWDGNEWVVQNDIETIRTTISILTEKDAQFQQTIDGLNSYVATLTETVETVSNDQGVLEERVLNSESRVSELEHTVDGLSVTMQEQYIGGINYVQNSSGLNGITDDWSYAFKDVVYQRLIELCTDICRRNGKTKLLWLGDKAKTLNYTPKSDEMVLTVHRWFANKSCPGNWMYARMGDLASKVTAALGSEVKPVEQAKPTGTIKTGDLVTITGSTYYNGKAIPSWVKKLRWYVVEVSGDRAVINKDESGRYAIMSPVKTSALAVADTKPAVDYRIHTVVHGDTLWAIAKKYLGDGSRYKEIVNLNGLKSNVIYSGMKLKIPNK